jgi:hypothetical protein
MLRSFKAALLGLLIAGWATSDLYVIGTAIPHDHAGLASRASLILITAFYNLLLTAITSIALTDIVRDR